MVRKILLIEDESQLSEIYSSVLEKNGFEVEVIKYGTQAKERLQAIYEGQKESPDLILLDLILPDLNGIEILEESRKHPQTKDIPCFVLTNYSDNELEKRSAALRAEKFILKTDYTPQELADMFKKLFER